ncbi:hypothetical protein [Ruegeria sp. SCP11]|uniref:hypothetical protein n=1 Tax=Ruegeria sp. SCP11 TaxID=3141378 RepID=UPI0033395D7C
MNITFRPYEPDDKEILVNILLSNCPKYFAQEDKADFVFFLNTYADKNFLVVEREEAIIGCGGHYTKQERHGIAWVMFKSGSLGCMNLMLIADKYYHEIETRILSEGKFFDIQIETTQLMEKFLNRFGFETMAVKPEGFGEGLDQLFMRKSLAGRGSE